MKYPLLPSIIILISLISCHPSGSYLHHKLAWTKIEGACSQRPSGFRMESNIAGDRFSFTDCLSSTYSGDYLVQRQGDTVLVELSKGAGETSLYELTLDIDAWPVYKFITIDGTTISLIRGGN